MRYIRTALFAVAIILCVSGCGTKPSSVFSTIPSGSEFVRITGRVKYEQNSVILYWSGTSVLARFSGRELKAILRDEKGENYFNVIIDSKFSHYIKLDTGKHVYPLVKGLSEGEHTIELIKRNEWDSGKTWFYGMEVTGRMLTLPPKKKRIIEFFGNSITAGYAIEDDSGGDSPAGSNTNNYPTYAALTACHYNADGYYTVKSGIGIMISWFPLIMPEMYNRLDPSDSLSMWDFKRVTPDIVVINLFQNDSWLVEKPEHASFVQKFGSQKPMEKDIVAAYASFIGKIRDAYPHAHIICALGSMDATRVGSPWPGYIQKAVTERNDPKIYTHFFPFTRKNGHPRKFDNVEMAERLISFIDKNITDW